MLAPVLAEVLYDKVGPFAPLAVFGPTMILTAIFAGEDLTRNMQYCTVVLCALYRHILCLVHGYSMFLVHLLSLFTCGLNFSEKLAYPY